MISTGFHTEFFAGRWGEPMVNVGFSIGGICARSVRKILKTHPLCHRPRPVLVQSVA